MPIQRRLPKYGFRSRKKLVSESVRLCDLAGVSADIISVATLKEAGLIRNNTKFVKIFLKGSLTKAVHVHGIGISKAAKTAVEASGGSVQ